MTVRFLDPPLHEFVPTEEADIELLAKDMGCLLYTSAHHLEPPRSAGFRRGHKGDLLHRGIAPHQRGGQCGPRSRIDRIEHKKGDVARGVGQTDAQMHRIAFLSIPLQ